MITLQLFDRPGRAVTYSPFPLGWYAQNWVQSTRAVGGFWQATFSVGGPRALLLSFFERWLGRMVRARYAGHVCWEGLIWELRLVVDGVEYTQTLDGEWFHNEVTVFFSSGIGARESTTTAVDTDSQAEFGEVQKYLSLGGATAGGADALRDRHMAEFGWPRSRMTGGIALGKTPRADGLYVTCAGFWATLNWRYRTTTITDTASAAITTLVGASEFVTAGTIATNALSVRVDATPNPVGLGEAIRRVAELGDASANVWQVGVYAGRALEYQAAPQTPTYFLRGRRLLDAAGREALAPLLKPGFLVHNGDMPGSWSPPGGAAWDDPRVAYVDEVEYARDTGLLTLSLYGEEESVLTVATQLRYGVTPGALSGGMRGTLLSGGLSSGGV